MIAQKMMDAKHSQEPGHPPVAGADLVAATSWTSSSEHPDSTFLCQKILIAAPKLRFSVSRILRTIRAARVDGDTARSEARSQQINLSGDPFRSSFPVIFPTVSR